jgi:hypothetical protein
LKQILQKQNQHQHRAMQKNNKNNKTDRATSDSVSKPGRLMQPTSEQEGSAIEMQSPVAKATRNSHPKTA